MSTTLRGVCLVCVFADLTCSSPLLSWFGSLALEGADGPLLEFGRSLLVGGSRDCHVCHCVRLLEE